jgi:membrane protein implicated in regulation of membrane protease activity
MWLIYLVALIVGGGVLLVQIASGFGHGLDHGVDHHPAGPGLMSTRAVTFGLVAFGMVGTPVHALGLLAPGAAFALAAGSGIGCAFLTGLALQRLGHPSASGAASLQEGRGQMARVIVACAPGRRGKVRLSLKGMLVDMIAVSQTEIPTGAAVRVLDVHDDVAQVEPAEEP